MGTQEAEDTSRAADFIARGLEGELAGTVRVDLGLGGLARTSRHDCGQFVSIVDCTHADRRSPGKQRRVLPIHAYDSAYELVEKAILMPSNVVLFPAQPECIGERWSPRSSRCNGASSAVSDSSNPGPLPYSPRLRLRRQQAWSHKSGPERKNRTSNSSHSVRRSSRTHHSRHSRPVSGVFNLQTRLRKYLVGLRPKTAFALRISPSAPPRTGHGAGGVSVRRRIASSACSERGYMVGDGGGVAEQVDDPGGRECVLSLPIERVAIGRRG